VKDQIKDTVALLEAAREAEWRAFLARTVPQGSSAADARRAERAAAAERRRFELATRRQVRRAELEIRAACLAAVAGRYRDGLPAGGEVTRHAVRALDRIAWARDALARNGRPDLVFGALFLHLATCTGALARAGPPPTAV